MAVPTARVRLVQDGGEQIIATNRNVARSYQEIGAAALPVGTILDQHSKILSSPAGPVAGLDRATRAANNTAKALGNVRKTSGTVNSTLLSTGRIVQDLPYGFGAVANNIAFTVEQMGFLAAQAGGTTAALKALGRALWGPIGIILGLNAAIAALQVFTMKTKQSKGEVKSLADEVARLKFREEGNPLSSISLTKAATAVVALTSKLRELQEEQDKLNLLITDPDAGPAEIQRYKTLQKLIPQVESVIDSLYNQVADEQARRELERILRLLGFLTRETKAWERAAAEARQTLAFFGQVGTPSGINVLGQSPFAGSIAAARAQTEQTNLLTGEVIREGFVPLGNEIPGLESKISSLSRAIESELNASLADTIRAMSRLENQIESGLTNAISGLAEGIVSGDPFSALRNVIADFATDLGRSMIRFGVAGIAVKRFITNPAAAIAAGTALVVLGAALRRTAQAKSESFSESGSAGGARRLQTVETSNQVTTNDIAAAQAFGRAAPLGFGNRQLVAKIDGRELVFFVDRSRSDINAVSV